MSKPWFGPKKFGYGLTPVSWEGWVVVLVIALGFAGLGLVFA